MIHKAHKYSISTVGHGYKRWFSLLRLRCMPNYENNIFRYANPNYLAVNWPFTWTIWCTSKLSLCTNFSDVNTAVYSNPPLYFHSFITFSTHWQCSPHFIEQIFTIFATLCNIICPAVLSLSPNICPHLPFSHIYNLHKCGDNNKMWNKVMCLD